jgi:uncharacterized membrane protein YdjX (TVP38/TMEM64 family)
MSEMSTVPVLPAWRRFLPLAAVAVVLTAAWAGGLGDYLSLEAAARHRGELKGFVAEHRVLAVAAFMACYVAAVALSLPGAAVLSVLGGFLFGWLISVPATVTSATLGGLIVFGLVKTSLGEVMAMRAGPFLRKLSGGFARDAFHYLLFLRLTPVIPFFVVNAVAGLCNVKTSTFALATALGIVPAAIAYAYVGMGLDSVIDAQLLSHQACLASKGAALCPFHIDAAALFTAPMILAFVALAVMALVPLAVRRWRQA